MKLPLTDKFLWDLHDLIESLDDGLRVILPPVKTMKEAWYPDSLGLRRKYQKERSRKDFNQFIYYLKRKGYIKIKNLESRQAIALTPKGAEKALRAKFTMGERPKRKDGKWLMVVFDVPEKKRRLRDFFREYLKSLGFKMLQRSIWVCPFDVINKVEEVARQHSLDPYIRVFLIEEL